MKFIFALGIDVENIMIPSKENEDGSEGIVFDLKDSRSIKTMREEAANKLDEDSRKKGPFILTFAIDWRDGFGANRAKSLRKTLVAWTFTLSPPKDTSCWSRSS